ncbi:hypothetical protein Rhal01_02723 [Rubritalea halochordaticola]|uniref:Uncharacterized protein n=1 Tax=Rubritalea halochordaticola TaxID=714537 RepID=A0ABP9V3N2_9BACT
MLIQNEYLADALMWLCLLLPLLLVLWKHAYSHTTWPAIWIVATILGWSLGYIGLHASPAENGFANLVMLVFGWLILLPGLALATLIVYFPLLKWGSQRLSLKLVPILTIICLILPLKAMFTWMPENQAIEAAEREMQLTKFESFSFQEAERTWRGWIIYYKIPNQSLYPVYLSRGGECTGKGG